MSNAPLICCALYPISFTLWTATVDIVSSSVVCPKESPPLAFGWLSPFLLLSYTIQNYFVLMSVLRIGECPSIAPFLENNGPRPRKGPRSIVFKEWNDTRTFAYVKSTQQLQLLPRYM